VSEVVDSVMTLNSRVKFWDLTYLRAVFCKLMFVSIYSIPVPKMLAGNGVIKRLYRQGMFVGSLQGDHNFQQLDFQSVTPLLLILGTGIILATFVFVIEIIINKSSRKLTRF
jgi:hypothetical protein